MTPEQNRQTTELSSEMVKMHLARGIVLSVCHQGGISQARLAEPVVGKADSKLQSSTFCMAEYCKQGAGEGSYSGG